MSEIIVDTERLAYDLETGLPEVDNSYARLEPDLRLRYKGCELTSEAARQAGKAQGIPIATKVFPGFWLDPNLNHVVDFISEGTESEKLLDLTFSQFYAYVGLWVGVKNCGALFPSEKILLANTLDLGRVATEVALRAVGLRQELGCQNGRANQLFNIGQLSEAPVEQVIDAYKALWDYREYKPFIAGNDMQLQAAKLAKFISPKCFVVS